MMQLNVPKSGKVRFLSSGEFVSVRSTVHPRRILDHFVLLIGIDGKNRIRHDGREYTLEKGSYLLLFPEKEHCGVAPTEGNQSHFWCHFQISNPIVSDGDACGIAEYGRLPSPDKYILLYRQLIDAEYAKYPNETIRHRICNAYTEILLSELFSDNELLRQEQQMGSSDKARRLITDIKEWIRLHCQEKISPKDVASVFGYHPDYLNSIFQRQTKKTVGNYLNGLRMEKAKKLLLTTNLRIKEIAVEVGFEDERYFMRAFKKAVGTTPTEFRNTYFHLHVNTNE